MFLPKKDIKLLEEVVEILDNIPTYTQAAEDHYKALAAKVDKLRNKASLINLKIRSKRK